MDALRIAMTQAAGAGQVASGIATYGNQATEPRGGTGARYASHHQGPCRPTLPRVADQGTEVTRDVAMTRLPDETASARGAPAVPPERASWLLVAPRAEALRRGPPLPGAREQDDHREHRARVSTSPTPHKGCTAHAWCCLLRHACAVAFRSPNLHAKRDIAGVIRSPERRSPGCTYSRNDVEMSRSLATTRPCTRTRAFAVEEVPYGHCECEGLIMAKTSRGLRRSRAMPMR